MATGLAALAVAFVVWRTAARSARSAPAAKRQRRRGRDRRAQTRIRAHAARAAIAGHVTAAGKPVAGAKVCADPSGIGVLGRDAICTDTDASGAYALADLLTAEYTISADARGMRPASAHQHLDAGAHATIDLAMKAGGVELAGMVADIGGGPIAHAQLRSGDAVVESDDAGHFSLWVEAGDVSISASADGYAPASWNGHAPDKPELRLQPESSLSGTVIGADGEPVPGVKVSIDGLDWHQSSVETTSEDDGTFHADRLSPGRYTITVRAPHAYGVSDGSVLVALAEHTDGVIITVVPAFQVAGKLTGPDGKPCDGWLRLVDEDHARDLSGWGDPSGAVEVDGVLPGTYKITANCTGFIAKDAGMIDIKNKDLTGQTWTVEAGATVKGKVTLHDGTPVEGANVRFQGAGWGSTTTAADGTYRVDGLAAGSYETSIVAPHGMLDAGGVRRRRARHGGARLRARRRRDNQGRRRRHAWRSGPRRVRAGARQLHDGHGRHRRQLRARAGHRGEHDLMVMVADHDFSKPGADPDAEEPVGHVSVAAGQIATTRLVVELETSADHGVVVDGTGAPVRDAYVDLTPSSGEAVPAGSHGRRRRVPVPGGQGRALSRARVRRRARREGRGHRARRQARVQLTSPPRSRGIVRGAPEELTIISPARCGAPRASSAPAGSSRSTTSGRAATTSCSTARTAMPSG